MSAYLVCDECGADVNVDLARDDSPDDAVDNEGWEWHGVLLDRLLCPECSEQAGND